ncbi:MAG: Type pilus biosis protein PilQ [Labilithrix sp.]|nr:Type pilus biosis protein PilQ [Labilithrix sp.]
MPSSPSSPAPFPATAFRSDEAPAHSRFDTRRIGDGDAAPAARFHGAPVDLDLKSADLANVFRLLADVGHVNIVVAGEITGTVTLRLKHVPWDQALDVIARTKELDLERDGDVIFVRSARKP